MPHYRKKTPPERADHSINNPTMTRRRIILPVIVVAVLALEHLPFRRSVSTASEIGSAFLLAYGAQRIADRVDQTVDRSHGHAA